MFCKVVELEAFRGALGSRGVWRVSSRARQGVLYNQHLGGAPVRRSVCLRMVLGGAEQDLWRILFGKRDLRESIVFWALLLLPFPLMPFPPLATPQRL